MSKSTIKRKYKVIELFSGIGAQRMALKRIAESHPELDFEYVAQCEIDTSAIQSYNAIHGETPNLGDICKVSKLPDCDILTWSFPCQALSMAGKREGMEKDSGTTSSLAWEVLRVLENTDHKPEWLLMENVPAILHKQNLKHFNKLIEKLTQIGYNSKYSILNAMDFNIPQNRSRCFMISHYQDTVPEFPVGEGLTRCIEDFIEPDCDIPPNLFLPKERIKIDEESLKNRKKKLMLSKEISRYRQDRILNDISGASPTITTHSTSNLRITYLKPLVYDLGVSPYKSANVGFDINEPISTLTACHSGIAFPKIVIERERERVVRRLTSRETWRLMGIKDEDYDKAKEVTTTYQLYKQAGNSIVVDVLVALFSTMLLNKDSQKYQTNLEKWS